MPYLTDANSRSATPENAFQILVKKLSDVLGPSSGIDSDDVDTDDLQNLLNAYTSNQEEWQQYAFGDSSRCYTRNLVDEGNGKSNLLVIVWNPAKGSPIHDHANAHCVMKILKGSLKETLYATLPSSSKLAIQCAPDMTKETIYAENEVTYISDDIGLHKISNASDTEIAVSLHLYTPPHAANFGFNLFDERTGKATHIKQVGFFSERGRRLEK